MGEWLSTVLNTISKVRIIQCWVILPQSCPSLCDPMDCSLPGSSVHGIFQARILEWVAISFSKYNVHMLIYNVSICVFARGCSSSSGSLLPKIFPLLTFTTLSFCTLKFRTRSWSVLDHTRNCFLFSNLFSAHRGLKISWPSESPRQKLQKVFFFFFFFNIFRSVIISQ